MAYPARLHLDQDLTRNRRRDLAFDQLEWSIGVLHLNRTHARPGSLHWFTLHRAERCPSDRLVSIKDAAMVSVPRRPASQGQFLAGRFWLRRWRPA
jgi:hypothetical protein